jgi:hypothetical protein
MNFDENDFQEEELTLESETIKFRSYRNIVYVSKPVDKEYQSMNIFAPSTYFEGGSINGYNIRTAPVFMPNTVGGYMSGVLDEPGYMKFGPKALNSIFKALQHGYVVAAPSIRGRVLKGAEDTYIGKAPGCIIDYKAAVRFLHYFSEKLPGDQNKIITNGTSAGGALSSLMGATGNHKDYELYMEEIGALKAKDNIFAASCYCPITNLDHADMAYEWQFSGIYDYHRKKMQMGEGGRPIFTPVDGNMMTEEIQISIDEEQLFPAYVESLKLKKPDGELLSLNENGEGSFKEAVKDVLLKSAQKALDEGIDLTDKKWLIVDNGKAESVDFSGWAADITRMKNAPAFDGVNLDTPENNLFGSEIINDRHFTEYSFNHSRVAGEKAEQHVIKLMNPMNYVSNEGAVKAKYWRIRHGECDRDTSLAISMILAYSLMENGAEVDYYSPWNTPHSGDYDLEDLFGWIDEICKC